MRIILGVVPFIGLAACAGDRAAGPPSARRRQAPFRRWSIAPPSRITSRLPTRSSPTGAGRTTRLGRPEATRPSAGQGSASRPPSHNLASRKAPEATNEALAAALMIAVLAGCVSLSDDARFGAVEQAVKERTGADTKWTRSDDGKQCPRPCEGVARQAARAHRGGADRAPEQSRPAGELRRGRHRRGGSRAGEPLARTDVLV